ncbi:TPA: hypothetical protein ACHYVN_004087 [Enterobacter hormaechei]|nr:hypothetical protein [Salmonella enterica]ECT4404983.1 hypothetical protein [Salmonella enterica]EEL4846034.1 hypothetical protein [Salmonella enterica]EGA5321910.1 hypothetical protein [Salmonella enterica]EJN2727548.1 hypothetical protein [Salmonella enterica]
METAFFDNDEYSMQMVYAIFHRHRQFDRASLHDALVGELRLIINAHPRPDSFTTLLTETLSRRGRKYLSNQEHWESDLAKLFGALNHALSVRTATDETLRTWSEEDRRISQFQTDGEFIALLLNYAPVLPPDCIALQLVRYINGYPWIPHRITAVVVTMIFRHLPYPETLKESFLLDPELRERYCHPDQDPRLSYALYLADELQLHL